MAVTGTPRVAVTVGTRTRSAALDRTAGPRSSASSLFFKYTVVEEDSDTEGVSIAANAISLNGATITATDDSTDAVLTHPAVPADPTRKVGSGSALAQRQGGSAPTPAAPPLDGLRQPAYAYHMPRHEERHAPQAPRRARLFRNGRNQALRIPRDLEFAADEVILHREDDRLVVEPVKRKRTLAEILPQLEPIAEEFPEIPDPPVRSEDVFRP